MKKIIIFLLVCTVMRFDKMHCMQFEKPSDIVFLVNKNTGERFSFPKDLFPQYHLVGYNNEITTILKNDFIEILRSLLYVNHGMICTGRSGISKCQKDIKKFFETSPLAQSHDFASWFELVFFVDLCNLPSIVKDSLLVHLTKLVKDHEQIAADMTANIESEASQNTLVATWKTIASFYHVLFDQELNIEGINHDYGYSIQQLFLLDAINKFPNKPYADGYLFDLHNAHINSLEGWELLLASLPKHERSTTKYFLNFNDNDISFISDNFLLHIPNLKGLSLKNNKITILPDNFLSHCPILEELIISDNRLQTLPDNFLLHCPQLKKIYLSDNQLQILPNNFLSTVPSLFQLILMNNELETLPSNFLSHCPRLQTLLLSSNKLQILPDNFLSNAQLLTSLMLHDNKLTILPDNFLSNAHYLTYLMLHDNNLTILPDNFLSQCPMLKELYIDNNQLLYLPPSFLYECPNLQNLLIKNSDNTYPSNHLNDATKVILEKTEAEDAKKRKLIEEEENSDQPKAKRQKTGP